MEQRYETGRAYGRYDDDSRSLQAVWTEMSNDMSRLVRKEVELAKVEATQKLTHAAKAGAMFSGMALTGFLALQVLSVTAALALALFMPMVLGFAIVGVAYLVLTGLLFATGRKKMKDFSSSPLRAPQMVKDDLRMAKSSLQQGIQGGGNGNYGRDWHGYQGR